MPHMLQIPAVVAKFVMENTRMAKEVYDFVSDLPLQDDSVLVPADVEFLKLWLLAAKQHQGGESVTSHVVALDFQPVVTNNEVFQEWKEQVLVSNLGPQEESPTGTPNQQQHQGNGGGGDVMQQSALGMAQQLNLLTQSWYNKSCTTIRQVRGTGRRKKHCTPSLMWPNYWDGQGWKNMSNCHRSGMSFWSQTMRTIIGRC